LTGFGLGDVLDLVVRADAAVCFGGVAVSDLRVCLVTTGFAGAFAAAGDLVCLFVGFDAFAAEVGVRGFFWALVFIGFVDAVACTALRGGLTRVMDLRAGNLDRGRSCRAVGSLDSSDVFLDDAFGEGLREALGRVLGEALDDALGDALGVGSAAGSNSCLACGDLEVLRFGRRTGVLRETARPRGRQWHPTV